MNFEGKRVVVTGASRGIGRELVKTLVEEGAIVAAVGRSVSRLEETRALTSDPDRVHLCPGDLRIAAEVQEIFRRAQTSLGRIDVLMNVAGVWHDEGREYQGPLAVETSAAEIDEVLDVG